MIEKGGKVTLASVELVLDLSQKQARAQALRESLSTGWLAGLTLTKLTLPITERRREVEDAANRLNRALGRYESAVGDANQAVRAALMRSLMDDDDGTDDREAIWQAGYKAATEDDPTPPGSPPVIKSLLRDIRLRLAADAEDEHDRMDVVSEPTKALLRRVRDALGE